jgi:hypothetical protein
MEQSNDYLTVRADGSVSAPDNFLAVSMIAKGVPVPGSDPAIARVRFSPSMMAQSILVEWQAGEPISIFPDHIAAALIRLNLARNPGAAAVAEFNARMAPIAEAVEVASKQSRKAKKNGSDAGQDEPEGGAGDDAAKEEE